MRGVLAIWRRELAGLFVTPLAWVLLFLAFLLDGYMLLSYLELGRGDVDLAVRLALGDSWLFWTLLVLFPPLLTMRMISEEARSGMLEFLLTAPVSDAAVVLGKFLAATTFMAILWSSVFVYALVLASVGVAPDPGILIGGFLGAVLTSALFSAIGLLSSSLTDAPILATFAAVLANIVVVLAPVLGRLLDAPWARFLVARVDVLDHHKNSFLWGVFDTAYAAFFVAWTAFALFLVVRSLEARRWR